ncbi:MAG TPA: 16S rRNA processing protein RimM [Candidatus Limivivens merdigallinarum]|uniref:Ribosome maturation factor RimM n=1 Tax=Candidatus Limivivens merdigallinarum TaxID=2840859 RepID=A0A9D0ZVP2_9FIRM|nr:16S rRNA processing protein RimM [Candidatus Limivivens merdigallinarum]
MEVFFKVGVITSPHGIRGEVKVFPTTDDPARFKKLKEVFLDTGKERIVLHIAQVKLFKQFVILKFREYDSINEVENFRKKELWISRSQAVPLQKDEYFIADLIGISVELEDGRMLGVLKDVIQTGANDVYVVECTDGREVMIPAIKDCILSVDVEEGRMVVHLLKGLMEL